MPIWPQSKCLALALVAAAAVYLTPATSFALDKVVLGLDWTPLGRHAGFFVAKAKGFYEREGLDVDIQRGYGAADSVKKLGAGETTFAFGDYGSLILARSEGIKAKAIAMIYARGPFVLWTRADAKINSPKDLPGKRIGSPAGASVRLMFPAFASAAKFDDKAVKWITVDAAGLYPLLFSGQADAIVDYEVGWPTISKRAKEANISLRPLKFADFGFDIYSNAIMATDDTLKNKPDLARRFVKASLEGMRAAFADPAAAGEIMKKNFPVLDADTAGQEVAIVKSLAETADAKAHGLGYISLAKAKLTDDVVTKTYAIKTPVPAEDTFTDDFLPK
ncbi:MAG TPA: ABC transporter substrate-binding protein [Pseudolabrys sp.]|nr:ABC transporter substrate-binding protein [Pseudolabrys sp.]